MVFGRPDHVDANFLSRPDIYLLVAETLSMLNNDTSYKLWLIMPYGLGMDTINKTAFFSVVQLQCVHSVHKANTKSYVNSIKTSKCISAYACTMCPNLSVNKQEFILFKCKWVHANLTIFITSKIFFHWFQYDRYNLI